jgi:hypothetical protein
MFEARGEISDYLESTAYGMHHQYRDMKHIEANESY